MMASYYKAAMIGRRSKAVGEQWEKIIDQSCEYYSEKGEAVIEKTPEAMKPIRRLKNGQFVAVYTKMAQPDYKGTLTGGHTIVFEAKHTDADRMLRSVISSEQEKQLNKYSALGAECSVMISFGFKKFYKVPWAVFRDMKLHFGRKYIVPQDLEKYEIHYIGGVLRFLTCSPFMGQEAF